MPEQSLEGQPGWIQGVFVRIPELFEDGRTGFLVEREDPAGLAEAIGKLLDDPKLRSEMGKRGRERCRDLFSWDVIARETAKRYDWAREQQLAGGER